jgi:hypothetical protein
MCMNCGCGEMSERHHETDITREDIERAAEGGEMTLSEATANLRSSLDQLQRDGQQAASAS